MPGPTQLVHVFGILVAVMSPGSRSQLEGSIARCDVDGEEIHIPHISDDPCITCLCQDGEVACSKEKCTMLEGCHMILFDKPQEQCCDLCKGCLFRNRAYLSGDVWRNQGDICKENRCQAGVVTSSKLRCHVACDNPISVPGECCPVCPGCTIENLTVDEGTSVISPHDQCATCTCKNGNLECSKRACPVLNCPARHVHTPENACCPICKGSRSVFDLGERACLFRSRIFPNQTDVVPDQCTECTCIRGTLQCTRRVCPPLVCKNGVPQLEPNDCCPRCVKPKKPCKFKRKVYKHGESWHRDACTNCSCTDGVIHCHVDQCDNTLDCPGNYRLQYTRDHCCPVCVEEDAVCAVFGDPHYKTFDGHIFNFQGPCTYTLVQDCINRDFSIRVRNSARMTNQFAWTKAVSVRIGDIRISLQQRLRVKVNRKRVFLPHHERGLFTIMQGGHSVTVKTTFGLKIVWDGNSYAEVVLAPSFKNKVCGLCGNYNGQSNDDMLGRDGMLYFDPRAFGETWLVGKGRSCPRDELLLNTVMSPCQQSIRHQLRSERECAVLLGYVFESCHNKVNVDPYYRSCYLDMCDCPKRSHCACESLTAYARACRREGIKIKWRSATRCGEPVCPRGSVYKTCTSACVATCESARAARPEICDAACVPGCECRGGRVLHNDTCVRREDCPGTNTTLPES